MELPSNNGEAMSRPGWVYSRMHNGWWNRQWRVVVRRNPGILLWGIYILDANGVAVGGGPYTQAWGLAWAKEMSWR